VRLYKSLITAWNIYPVRKGWAREIEKSLLNTFPRVYCPIPAFVEESTLIDYHQVLLKYVSESITQKEILSQKLDEWQEQTTVAQENNISGATPYLDISQGILSENIVGPDAESACVKEMEQI